MKAFARRLGFWCAALALGFTVNATAFAHAVSSNYLILRVADSGAVQGRWDVAVSDLDWALALDSNQDSRITWGEIQARRADIDALLVSSLELKRGGSSCAPSINDLALTEHAGEPHVVMILGGRCGGAGTLSIASRMFAEQDASEKTLLDLTATQGRFTAVISADSGTWTEPARVSWGGTLLSFVAQGLSHVWTGYDHIAFLLLLLLPSVLRQGRGRWLAAQSQRQILRDLLTIVTAFTVAHSITLALAATGTLHPPVKWVEATIAFSIVAAGVLNLFPRGARWRLPIAFGFGLMHGFGFANALSELGASGARLVPALAGFNIGVELAQLSIVMIALPLLLRFRTKPFYAARIMPWASAATACAGVVWLLQRI